MNEDNYSVNVNCVVSGIFKHRLKKSGHIWQTSPVEICRNNKVVDTACKLCDEFEKRYENVFRKLGLEFNGSELTLDSFYSVLDHMLEDGLNWGRVTGILTFASVMAVLAMDKQKDYQVELIRDWTCSYIQSQIDPWMKENDGWVGSIMNKCFHPTAREINVTLGSVKHLSYPAVQAKPSHSDTMLLHLHFKS